MKESRNGPKRHLSKHHLIPVMMKTGLSRGYHVVSRRFLVWWQINNIKLVTSNLHHVSFSNVYHCLSHNLSPSVWCSYHLSPSNSGFDRPGPQWVWPQWKGPGREATAKIWSREATAHPKHQQHRYNTHRIHVWYIYIYTNIGGIVYWW